MLRSRKAPRGSGIRRTASGNSFANPSCFTWNRGGVGASARIAGPTMFHVEPRAARTLGGLLGRAPFAV